MISKRKSMIIRLLNEFDETLEMIESLRTSILESIEELEREE